MYTVIKTDQLVKHKMTVENCAWDTAVCVRVRVFMMKCTLGCFAICAFNWNTEILFGVSSLLFCTSIARTTGTQLFIHVSYFSLLFVCAFKNCSYFRTDSKAPAVAVEMQLYKRHFVHVGFRTDFDPSGKFTQIYRLCLQNFVLFRFYWMENIITFISTLTSIQL